MSRCCELPTSLITKALFIQFSTSLYWIFCVSLCARLINFLFFLSVYGTRSLGNPYYSLLHCLHMLALLQPLCNTQPVGAYITPVIT